MTRLVSVTQAQRHGNTVDAAHNGHDVFSIDYMASPV